MVRGFSCLSMWDLGQVVLGFYNRLKICKVSYGSLHVGFKSLCQGFYDGVMKVTLQGCVRGFMWGPLVLAV